MAKDSTKIESRAARGGTITVLSLARWVGDCAETIARNRDLLNELDASSGDADHGSNLDRGMRAVEKAVKVESGELPREYLRRVGTTIVDEVGGSSGALYGTFFLRLALAADAATQIDAEHFGRMLAAAATGIVDRGGASVGDKTMFDALSPAVAAYGVSISAGGTLHDGLVAAAIAGHHGAESTRDMIAKKGRASYLGERTRGHPDAGSVSMALIIDAAARTFV